MSLPSDHADRMRRARLSLEGALWATVSGFGDRDTTCAIVGGVVSLAVGRDALPSGWLAYRESLTTLAEGIH